MIEQVFEQRIGTPILSLKNEILAEFEVLTTQLERVYHSNKKEKTNLLKRYLEIVLLEIQQFNQSSSLVQSVYFQRFLRFKKDLKQHYAQQHGVSFYANKQHITSKTLNIAIRQLVNKSAKQFINEYLILLAKRAIVNTYLTTAQIAINLGFSEPTNFTKFFKRYVLLSPSTFQKRLKKSKS